MNVKDYCFKGQDRLQPHQWSRKYGKYASPAAHSHAGLQARKLRLSSRLIFHGTHVKCTVFRRGKSSENGFRHIDSAGSPRSYKICEQRYPIHKCAAAGKAREYTPTERAAPEILDTRTRTAVSNKHVLPQCHKTEPNEQTGRVK